MFSDKKVLGVIPARGGSKSIPSKNIVHIGGKPLIYYIINTANKATEDGVIDRFIVSTDSKDIAKLAKKFGAEVPFLRPKELATDTSSDLDFMKHAYLEMKRLGFKADILVNLRPTSPFLKVDDIRNVIEIIQKSKGTSVRSVSKLPHNYHPYWLKKVLGNRAVPFLKGYDEKKYYNRQLLPILYRLNAAVDAVLAENVLKGDLYGKDMRVYIMEDDFLDINNKFDFLLADRLLKENL